MQKVSLIIPIYNVELYLPRLFTSIDNLNYGNKEIIFVNDGSTDRSLELLKNYVSNNPICCKIINKINSGLNPARKTGLEHSTGDLIIFSDSDDYFDKYYIDNLIKYINDEIDIVCSPLITEDDKGKFISVLNRPSINNQILNKDEAIKKLLSNYEIGNFLPGKLYKKKLFEDVDFSFNKPFEDYTISHVIFNNANKVVLTNVASYHYIKHGGTLSTISLTSYTSCLEAILIRRSWIISNYRDIYFLKLVDESLFDRFIQIVSKYRIKNSKQPYNTVLNIFKTDSKKIKFNKYSKRNIKFYRIFPKIYFKIKSKKKGN